jgi:transcriptional regulator GlxA family with amidase domain
MKRKLNAFEPGEDFGRRPVRKKESIFGCQGIATKHGGVNRSLAFMAKKFCQPIAVKDLVAISGLSRRGFFKAFEKHVGANPGAVLRHARLEYAKRLLTGQDLKLKAIAQRCGYRRKNTFCVAFQRTTGMAPKQFQRRYGLAASQRNPRGGLQQTRSNTVIPMMLAVTSK